MSRRVRLCPGNHSGTCSGSPPRSDDLLVNKSTTKSPPLTCRCLSPLVIAAARSSRRCAESAEDNITSMA
eukprot:6365474-Pyramimonas_sp.AAC.1